MKRSLLLIFALVIAVSALSFCRQVEDRENHITIRSKPSFSLPSYFSSNMVLQRESEVNLWGTSEEIGHKLIVRTSWDRRAYKTIVGEDGRWEVTINTPSGGGPYSISFDGHECETLKNIMIGDVWFCSGQSNMEILLSGFLGDVPYGGLEAIAAAKPEVPIRMFLSEYDGDTRIFQYAREPQTDLKGSWRVNNPENTTNTSALAYFFACRLQKELNIPIGIIVSSIGSTGIQSWMSAEALRKFPNFDGETYKTASFSGMDFIYYPVVLYNGQVNPFINYPIKGMVWYQGETNCGDERYCDYQAEFVRDLREKWDIGEFPFYFFQIAPYSYDNSCGTVAAEMRETQEMSVGMIPNSAMICLQDLGDESNIHPFQKKSAAERCADAALALTYGRKDIHYACPSFAGVRFDGNKAVVGISCAKNLVGVGESFNGFELAGSDGKLYPATGVVGADNTITVTSSQVPSPAQVRYCFHNYDAATVFDEGGLPLKPFRSLKN